MKNEKNNTIFKILSIAVLVFCLICLGIFSLSLFKLNIIPSKYLIIFYAILTIFLSLIAVYLFKGKGYILKAIMIVILMIISIVLLFARAYIGETYRFLSNLYTEKYGYLSYSVVVLKDSSYQTLDDLKNKTIAYLEDEHTEKVEKELKIDYEKIKKEDFGELTESLLQGEVEAIVLESTYLDIANLNIANFDESIKIIHTFEIQISNTTSKDDEPEVNIATEPFILYISGIDQYGNVNSIRGRSDVNQLAFVNPKTNKILLVNTPRDYYVQLHDKTGLKDKLTHAGIYGIDMSMKTLEDLYDINIDYYLRVNFNTLIKVVDEIGGIDIYSDKAFTAYTNGRVHVKEGINHFDGVSALAYSRERYAYATGDRHRGENQQQVISAIIDKVTTSEVLIKNYNNILETLSETFQTNMEVETMTTFLRYQLDKMPNWTVESTSVTGSDSKNYTYSMGTKYLLYVMEPSIGSIEDAKDKIKEVLNEN